MVYPHQDAVVADPVLMESAQFSRQMFEGKSQGLRVLRQPFYPFDDARSRCAVKTPQVIIELCRRLYSIQSSRLRSFRGRI